jgi:hypothetical protein
MRSLLTMVRESASNGNGFSFYLVLYIIHSFGVAQLIDEMPFFMGTGNVMKMPLFVSVVAMDEILTSLCKIFFLHHL